MPPKPIVSAVKGQQSLFSFFNKAVPSSNEKSLEKSVIQPNIIPTSSTPSGIVRDVNATHTDFKTATTRDEV